MMSGPSTGAAFCGRAGTVQRARRPVGVVAGGVAAVVALAGGMPALQQGALAQQYRATVSSTATASSTSGLTLNFNSTVTGTYNATTNPTGTRAILGNFNIIFPPAPPAAPRNDTCPLNGTATGNGTSSTSPRGTYTLRYNAFSRTVELFGLNIDLNGVSPDPTLNVSASVSYSSFRIVFPPNPTYNYPWLGSALTIPLGAVTITDLALRQDGAGVATGTPRASGGVDFAMTVPVRAVGIASFQGQPIPVDAPAVVQFTGWINPAGASATSQLSVASLAITQVLPPVPGDPLNPTPFELPPPPLTTGPNAPVLSVLSVTGGNVSFGGSVSLPSTGARTSIADVGGSGQSRGPDGERTADDIIVFIAAFTSADPLADIAGPGPTDTPDGQYTADDVILFINAFLTP